MFAPASRRARRLPWRARALALLGVALLLGGLSPRGVAAGTAPLALDRPEPTAAITSTHPHFDSLSSSCGASYYNTLSVTSRLETVGGDPNWLRFLSFQSVFWMEGNSSVSTGDLWISNANTRYYTDTNYARSLWRSGQGFGTPIDSSPGARDNAGFVLPYSYSSPAEINIQLYPGGYPEDLSSFCAYYDAQGYFPTGANGGPFIDVARNSPEYYPIYALYREGIVGGYPPDYRTVGPNDPINRAQMAATIARANGWDRISDCGGSCFNDISGIDETLRDNICTLQAYGIVHGYGDGSYGPYDPVLYVQAVSFITRALVYRGVWQQQSDTGVVYPNIPASSGHRDDLTTHYHYTGAAPGTQPYDYWAFWEDNATRGWVFQDQWMGVLSTR